MSAETVKAGIKNCLQGMVWASQWYDKGRYEMATQIALASLPLFEANQANAPLLQEVESEGPAGMVSTTTFGEAPSTRNMFGFLGVLPAINSFQAEFAKSGRRTEIPWRDWWAIEPIMPVPGGSGTTLGQTITRRELFLGVASTGDEDSQAKVARLKEGFKMRLPHPKGSGVTVLHLRNAHMAALRQIGHEIYTSPTILKLIGGSLATLAGEVMPPPSRIDVEPEMDRFVRAFGGEVVEDIVGPSPPFLNADYIFRTANIVAELKCMTDDKSEDSKVQAHIDKLFEKYATRGDIPDPGPGWRRFQSKDLPVQMQKELYRILSKPLKRRLLKANNQIKVTKEKLNLPGAHGLLLLANDGNYRLEPAQWAYAVQSALGQDFSGIDTVVLFTANLLATSPFVPTHTLMWAAASRQGHPVIDEVFLRGFHEGWAAHVGKVMGNPVATIYLPEHAGLDTIQYDAVLSRARPQSP